MNRREFIRSLVVSSALLATSGIGFAEIVTIAKTKNQQPVASVTQSTVQTLQSSSTTVSTSSQQQQQTTTAVPSGYVLITQLSALGSETSAYFTHPNFGSSIFVNVSGQWKAFSAICTHRVCTLDYVGSSIYCPCHGATFSPSNGSVTRGPAPTAIAEYGVQILNGNVYVSLNRIN